MTTTAETGLPDEPLRHLSSLDVSATARVPFTRLVAVELRKLWDTRAGVWLLISTGVLTAIVLVIQLAVILTQDLAVHLQDFIVGMNVPMGILLPVLGVMSVTSEWSQRTAMTTFTLEPSRPRLLLAKLCAVLLVALVAVAVGLVLALVANALYGALSGNHVTWGLTVVKVLCLFLLHVFGMLVGFMLGTVFLNTPTAIVLYFVYGFVLPPLFSIGASLMTWFRHLQPWIDFNDAQNPLIQGHLTGEQVAHLATSGALWLVLPMVFGVWRLLRAEVK